MAVNTPKVLENPYRPGAGHMPPWLAGRSREQAEFEKLLTQTTILENLVLTGLRGVGKTVFLERLKPIAQQEDWLWVGTDLSESASVSEDALAVRILADLSVATSSLVVASHQAAGFGAETEQITLNYQTLAGIYDNTPGLVADKLKAVLETAAAAVDGVGKRGIIFAYDEAQHLADDQDRDEFPLGVLLDVFQSIQKRDIPFMLVLTGLPTLFPKLVESRTYAERMFHVITLDRLEHDDSAEAILKPLEGRPDRFNDDSVEIVIQESGGYPYFIQFICREIYDLFIQQIKDGVTPSVPIIEITKKLDSDFFAGRWAQATDRQRDLMWAIADLDNADGEFTVQEIVAHSAEILEKPFGSSNVNQMLATLCKSGLIFKNRWGKYSFAVPMFDRFILRQRAAA